METRSHIAKLIKLNKARSLEFRRIRQHWTGKVCTACNKLKPFSEFGNQKKTWDGKQSWCLICRRIKNRNTLRALIVNTRSAVFDKLGRSCARCGFSDIRALQIDHVFGNGRLDRVKNRTNVSTYKKILASLPSDKYQILCANCNWIKRIENNELPKRVDDGN